jgi:hypothetical protein
MEDLGAPVEPTDEVLLRDRDVAKDDPPRAAAPRPHQPVEVLDLDRVAPIDQQGRDALLWRRLLVQVGAGVDQKEVGPLGPHHEALHPPQQEVIPHIAGGARGAEEVGAAARLGQRFRRHLLSPEHRREVPLLLLLGAEAVKRLTHDRGHNKGAARRHPQTPDLTLHRRVPDPGEPLAAVLLWEP